MAWDGYVTFGGAELFNTYRTAALAQDLGIDVVWPDPDDLEWIGAVSAGDDTDITTAPWYDPGVPASMEFAGVLPLSIQGLDDSTLSSTPVEYITDGGNSGKPRNSTLAMVVSAAVIASTERGAEYGLRWLNRLLRGGSYDNQGSFCAGVDLRYFRYQGSSSDLPPFAHRRDVRLTRGSSVTRKRGTDCAVTWTLTFTLTAADPYEYGDTVPIIDYMDLDEYAIPAPGAGVIDDGSLVLVNESCPVYDYTPIYDPLYPALVPAPAPPNMLPDGWTISDGDTFERLWCTMHQFEPSYLDVVPILTMSTDVVARMVRVGIWAPGTHPNEQCNGLLFGFVVSYLPVGTTLYIDGEQQVAYAWDGSSSVRRADSLVYSWSAGPVDWKAFQFEEGTMLTMDLFGDSDGFEGSVLTKVGLSLVSKSD